MSRPLQPSPLAEAAPFLCVALAIAAMMPSYRNVAGFQSGCFQYQTPFMSTKGLAAHVGGWIIRVIPSARGEYNMRILSEFIPFF